MAIPWLIGAAVVAVAAAVINSSSEDEKKRKEKEEREARREAKRISEEAVAKREEAKKQEILRQQEAKNRAIRQYAYEQTRSFSEKHDIQGAVIVHVGSFDELSSLAINNPIRCKELFHKCFLQSKKVRDIDSHKKQVENQLQEIKELSNILTKLENV